MNERQFEFEWDDLKAAGNLRKHRVSFEQASTVFSDPRILSTADLEHSETEERWFSIVWAGPESDLASTKIRLISARKAIHTEVQYYKELYD